MLRTLPVALLVVAPLASVIGPSARISVAHANPAGVVPAPDLAGGGLVRVEAEYEYEQDSARIAREHVGPGVDPLGGVPSHRELDFHATRHTLTPKAELGLSHDFWLSFAAPIVLASSSELDLAPGVTRASSSTFQDGLLTGQGFDARDPGTPPAGNLVFRDINRTGVPELRLGLGWAPMSQARDATKPTWKLGAELHLSVGKVMRFDRTDPGAQAGVATGVDELKLWTSFDRRFDYFEGWFEASYQQSIVNRDASLYRDPGFGSTNLDPGQNAGAKFGLEAYLVNDHETGNQVSIDVSGRMNAHFEGRGYTELWQVFALAGDRRFGGPLVLDADPTVDGVQALSHPGISNYESYLETAAKLAVRGKLGPHVTFAGFGELIWKTDHAISFADAGVDLPTCPKGTPKCETETNDVINPGTREVNPVSSAKIDQVGHRFLSTENFGFVVGVEAAVLF
ncbi:MAG TPA: hypothetical protein VFP84_10000 [Kofleriaceae bacterium]|nr:hypothetical protein [Kofleriaceae bacterium]